MAGFSERIRHNTDVKKPKPPRSNSTSREIWLYYDEQLIGGVWYYRTVPTGKWIKFSDEMVTKKINSLHGLKSKLLTLAEDIDDSKIKRQILDIVSQST